MPLDIPASPNASQTIKYIRAAWDVVRDGGAVGTVLIPSQQLPTGAMVLGYAYQSVTPFTDLGTSGAVIMIGASGNAGTIDLANNDSGAAFVPDATFGWYEGSYPISLYITGDGYSAGSMLIYVFYV